MKSRQVAVIGAGASGLMAACFAAESSDVVLFKSSRKSAVRYSLPETAAAIYPTETPVLNTTMAKIPVL